ncbi:MAG: pyridoxal phosphate-dependent aminotransferase [Deltaproteobacteria bacterium]|uniref:Aminotransferase n=1 Tax=Candidatus Desulfacyla euxinica TaxID=2841693 RepID=A0A8J6N2C8_9DELT|nr:pyridoxal phosphate-dependent aminotransferase [Candidatus Desulfacyla euxinica]MBL7216093.1 pyridoxal phosphate-dependent aminotransferase [Desulfobacteraceae bacterium]
MPQISSRTSGLGTENAFVVLKEVNDLIAQGREIISFCIGQPDFNTPPNICEAAIKAIRDGRHGYTPSAGIPELREAVAEYVSMTRGVEVEPDWVVVANGAKPFIGFTLLSVTDYGQGHEVLYPNPGFPIYSSQAVAHGAVPVPLHLLESKDFSFDVDKLESMITPKTKLLILCSPQNPTGGVLTRETLEKIAEIAIKHDLWVYSDEVYSRMVHEGEFMSIASVPGMLERTIICDGASKTYAMTGWRLGYAVNQKLAPYFSTWMTNTTSCPNHMTQWAMVEALRGPQEEPDRMMAIFKERRDLIVNGLNEVEGITCLSPGGAFYAWPNITELCRIVGASDSEEFRKKLLYDAGVAVLADIHFGMRVPGEGQHIRFSYATSNENIIEGIERIKDFIRTNRR